MPFVTDKVGYEAGQEHVEIGDDPDVQEMFAQQMAMTPQVFFAVSQQEQEPINAMSLPECLTVLITINALVF